MGNWRGKYLEGGPPRGPGHYSQDGRWWWDDGQQRWFRVTDQEEVLEIEAEDMGGTSLAASLLTTLSSQYGNGYFRFVTRAHSADLRWPTYAMAGATFPGTRPSLEDVGAQGAWLQDQRERFQGAAPAAAGRGLAAGGPWRPLVVGQLPAARPGLGHPADAQPTPSYLSARQAGMGGVAMHAGLVRRAADAVLAGAAALVGYATLVRPRILRWGASDQEAAERLPGDEVVTRPRYQTTHAVTINAPPSRVWPWLVQLGQGRGGLYSYDWLENLFGLGFRSADRILPELQHLQVGDQVWLAPRDSAMPLWYQVLDLQPPQTLVLGPHGDRQEALDQGLPWPTWTFVLRDLGNGSSRLIVRMRSDFTPTPLGLLANKYALEPVHFAMERRMLLGIKHRAEQATAR